MAAPQAQSVAGSIGVPPLRLESEGRLRVEWWGQRPYREALALQEDALRLRRVAATGDRLILVEHPPVITFGRSARREHLVASPQQLAARGMETVEVSRGGDVTYHAPGQLVGYLVVDLAARARPDVTRFLRGIEAALIDALSQLGLPARRVPGRTGVFSGRDSGKNLPDRKIASIGIGLRGWVSWHGFALNVDLDLEGFSAIVPCGLRDVEMTSVARELAGEDSPLARADLSERSRSAVARAFVSWLA